MTISPGQARAARALLNMTQAELAELSAVGLQTIADFEDERRKPKQGDLASIRTALEVAGVDFIPPVMGGPGVCLVNRRRGPRYTLPA
jgi:transcriptional regulator with XRE-family HTH domain